MTCANASPRGHVHRVPGLGHPSLEDAADRRCARGYPARGSSASEPSLLRAALWISTISSELVMAACRGLQGASHRFAGFPRDQDVLEGAPIPVARRTAKTDSAFGLRLSPSQLEPSARLMGGWVCSISWS